MKLLEWLLDLEKVSLDSGQPLSLEWGRIMPPWLVAGFAAIAVLLIVFMYRRERAAKARLILLGSMRLLLLLLIGAVLCKPSLVWKRERSEPSTVVLLLDNSLSMANQDVYGEGERDLERSITEGAGLDAGKGTEAVSRLELVQAALTRDEGAVLNTLLSRHRLQLASFSNAVTDLGAAQPRQPAVDLVQELREVAADGAATDLSGAISAAIEKWAGSRLAGIVLASDGQSTTQHDLRPALELATRRGVPIYPLRVGSPVAPVDVEVSPPRAAATVLANDVVAVEATVSSRGLAQSTEVEVNLLDVRESEPELVATETMVLSPDKPEVRVELRTTPTLPGMHEYRVQAGAVPNERLTANNTDSVQVKVIDDRVRVLYVEGYPRYEYRYLKNALVRERTVELSVLLLEADERFVQEGTTPIRRFPDTREELNRYDVVLFGDVDPKRGWLSQSQMIMLLDFVANDGGGFGVIAGERAAPQRFFGTALEKLLPVTEGPRGPKAPASGFNLELTPEGKANRIFKFAGDGDENQAIIAALPHMYWSLANVQSKPGTTVLARSSSSGGESALIVAGQYGGGKLFFQATDDTWRWRRHTGEFLHDSYWVQVVRYLMPTSRLSSESTFSIRPDRRVYSYGEPVHIHVEVDDPLMPRNQQEIMLSVQKVGDTGESSTELELAARRVSFDPQVYDASFVPQAPGSYAIRFAEGLAQENRNSRNAAAIRVNEPDLESRRPAADHQTLELIAASTGGEVIPLNRLGEVLASLPDRSLLIPDDVEESLWDSKLVLGMFVLIIGLEWILRKAFGLL